MKARAGVAAATGAALAFLIEPVRSLAATANDCPAVVMPESPAGPALLIVGALSALSFLAYRRRRGRLAATVVSTLAIVVLTSALLSTVLASAATSSCAGGATDAPGQNGGVLAQTTPLTGADIPWITAGVLVVSGTAISLVSWGRRRRSSAER